MKDGKKIENVSLISKTNVGYVSYKNSFDDKIIVIRDWIYQA